MRHRTFVDTFTSESSVPFSCTSAAQIYGSCLVHQILGPFPKWGRFKLGFCTGSVIG